MSLTVICIECMFDHMETTTTPSDPTARADAAAAAARDHAGEGLDAVAVLLAAIDRLTATVVGILQGGDRDTAIAAHGVTCESWLRAVAGRTSADAGMLLAAAERLQHMPAIAAWFRDGVLSWGAVRGIVTATRSLTAAQRAWVDETLAADADRVARWDDDQLVDAVQGLADHARPDLHRDREAAGLRRRWLAIQPRLDGSADICGSLDPETAAAALAAFTATPSPDDREDAAAGDRNDAGGGLDEGDAGTAHAADQARAARRRSNVDIFKQLCEQRIARRRGARGGADQAGVPSTARPSMLIIADLQTLHGDGPMTSGRARLDWATRCGPVELTSGAVQRLACDATMRAVITDGPQILGVTAAHPKVSASLRAALAARDGGCRFPGCSQPVDLCDNHHVVPVAEDGPTTLANLVLLCRAHHHAIHDGGWRLCLDADSTVTVTRRGVTSTSLPRAAQHATVTEPPPRGRPRRHTTGRSRGQPSVQQATDDPFDAGRRSALEDLLPF